MPKKAKKVTTPVLKGLVTQSLLIVCSVLFALFLNGIWEQQKVTTNLATAYHNIRLEVESNRDALAAASQYRSKSIAAIDSLLQKNSRDISTAEFTEILSQIVPKGPDLPDLQSAAWDAFHSTGLMTHLKFDDAYPLTKLYKLQKEGVEHSRMELAKFLVQSERFEKQQNAANLNMLQHSLTELHEQEKHLLAETNKVLGAGQNWRYLE